MECPSCHHWNETGARFCEECGFDLTSVRANTAGDPSPMAVSAAPDGLPDGSDADSLSSDPVAIPDPPPQTLVTPDKPPTASVYSGPHFVLSATGSIFKLGPLTVIGREEPSAQIDFDGYPNGKYVSHRHAQITHNDGTFYIEDLDSANHTYVNDIRLSPGQSEPLHEGDRLRLGKIELLFHEK